MKISKKLVSVSLAAVCACGLLAGCDLVTTDTQKDMAQVIAEVDISLGEEFQTGGEYAKYAQAIGSSKVIKRDLVANFLSTGYYYVQNYGASYSETFQQIKDSLVNRRMVLQYAMVYFFEEGTYTVDGFTSATSGEFKNETARNIAATAYFLTDAEKAQAEFELKVTVNNTLDSQEKSIIKQEAHEHTAEVRTTPKGVNTANEDYYDATYEIYTGKNLVAECGSYEAVEGSTPATRVKAYNQFLGSLMENDLLSKGEDVSKFENLDYYQVELLAAYEDALISKLAEYYEAKAEKTLTEKYVTEKYATTLATQKESFKDTSAFESAIDAVSEKSFVLASPDNGYGYVINILLPFSKTQSKLLAEYEADFEEGEVFEYRNGLLKALRATDQRASWFTGETDYSYKAAEGEAYDGGEYLFFEDSVKATEGSRYELLKNYYGKYAYNGTVVYDKDEHKYTLTPEKIDIDGFISEMEGYLKSAGLTVNAGTKATGYYEQKAADFYNLDGSLDYSKFVYYTGSVNLANYSANDTFVAGTDVNKAFSIINELSFAYNTDTAGLNSYYGYSVSAYDTSFVKEFEYAAKEAVKGGVGTYTVAPSTYGWHIMYCTFTYSETEPYSFSYSDIAREGSFSNLYYEALKASTVEGYSTVMEKRIINNYASCVSVYQETYQDLLDLDKVS